MACIFGIENGFVTLYDVSTIEDANRVLGSAVIYFLSEEKNVATRLALIRCYFSIFSPFFLLQHAVIPNWLDRMCIC